MVPESYAFKDGEITQDDPLEFIAYLHFGVSGAYARATAPEVYDVDDVEKQLVSTAEHDNGIVVLAPPDDIAEQLAVGTEYKDDLHLTIASATLGGREPEEFVEEVSRIIANLNPPTFSGRAIRLETFEKVGTEANVDAIVVFVDVPGLTKWRYDVVNALELEGFVINREHPFNPHITISYLEPEEEHDIHELLDLPIEIPSFKVAVWSGDVRRDATENDFEKQSPPGPPPRPGLQWKYETHRWIRPKHEGTAEKYFQTPGSWGKDEEVQKHAKKLRNAAQKFMKEHLDAKTISKINKAAESYAAGHAQEDDWSFESFLQEEMIEFSEEKRQEIINIHRIMAQNFFGSNPRKLYRGIYGKKRLPKGMVNVGDTVKVSSKKMGSWTTDIDVANEFADGGMVVSRVFDPSEVIMAPVLFKGSFISDYSYQKEFVIGNSKRRLDVAVEEFMT